ncbi:MAG: dockerin type I domain-containing protein [Patescibacteria group bacterium]
MTFYVYPSSSSSNSPGYGDCQGLGAACVKKVFNKYAFRSGEEVIFNNMAISTHYVSGRCRISCTSSDSSDEDSFGETGGAALSNDGVPSMVCNNGNVDATVSWKNIDMRDEEVWLDYSVNNNNFTPGDSYSSVRIGSYNTAPFGRNDSKTIVNLPANTSYYWRIRTKDPSWSNNIWWYSQTGTFTTTGCSLPTPVPTPTPIPTPPPISCVTFINSAGVLKKYGDVNNNNIVNANDATLVKQTVFGVTPPLVRGTDAFKAADVNGNNVVSAADATLINQFYFKIITQFPIPGCS